MANENEPLKVSLDLRELYVNTSHGNATAWLEYGTIYASEEEGECYYDMYNDDGQICCMDGETHEVVDVNKDNGYIEFAGESGENDVLFRLAFSEAKLALNDYCVQQVEQRYGISLNDNDKQKQPRVKADRDDR